MKGNCEFAIPSLRNSLLAGKRPPPFGRDVINLHIHRSGGRHLVFAFLLVPAKILWATLVQKTPASPSRRCGFAVLIRNSGANGSTRVRIGQRKVRLGAAPA
ncbi:MAG: hypothetical protein DME96_09970 [Verrucomicrobia bacterium]|nr:MAG: hypothetical protein DME96_09970 [Verrucomicrobiota bacterium]